MDKKVFESWVRSYLKAWMTNAPVDIAALFTENATYLTQAFREPWAGRENIVKEWLGRADWANEPKDEWSFEYRWLAIEGDTGVLDGTTEYPKRGERGETYKNIWTIRLAEDGRCREFREYWVKKGAQ